MQWVYNHFLACFSIENIFVFIYLLSCHVSLRTKNNKRYDVNEYLRKFSTGKNHLGNAEIDILIFYFYLYKQIRLFQNIIISEFPHLFLKASVSVYDLYKQVLFTLISNRSLGHALELNCCHT